MRRRAAVVLMALATTACSEPLELADWTIPVPEGTRVIEYAPIPNEERRREILIVEDLVVQEEGGGEGYLFNTAVDLAVDKAGRMYVYDSGDYTVKVFDRNGDYLRSLGRRGAGPGEIAFEFGWVTVSGQHLVHAGRWGQLASWDLRNGTASSVSFEVSTPAFWDIGSTLDGDVVGIYARKNNSDGRFDHAISRISLDGREIVRYGTVPALGPTFLRRGDASSFSQYNTQIPYPVPGYDVAPGSAVYLTAGDEYQVVSLDIMSGTLNWALRVAWSRLPMTYEYIENRLSLLRAKHLPDAKRSEVVWPEFLPALSSRSQDIETIGYGHSIRVDGHGHLYVFPLDLADLREDSDAGRFAGPRPVDVYDAAANILCSCRMQPSSWLAVLGDAVYGIEMDEETAVQRIVRYRLVEPFE